MKLCLLYEDNVSQAVGILGGDSNKVYEFKSSGIPNKYLPLAARLAKVGGELEEISKIIKDITNLVDSKKIKIEMLRNELVIRANVSLDDFEPDYEYRFPYNDTLIDDLKEFLVGLEFKYLSMEQGEAASEEDLVATGDNIKVYYADSKAKCKAYGKNTTFCISANTDERNERHMYEYYRSMGFTTYFVFDDNNIGNPLNIVVVQVNNQGDIKLTDKTNDTGFLYNEMSPSEYYAYLRGKGVDTSVFKPKKLDASEVLKMGSIESIVDYANNVIGDRWPEAEHYIMRDPRAAIDYASDVIEDRWPEAEPRILRNPWAAKDYALKVIGDRWPEAEPIILRDPWAAKDYALKVIGDRWPEAEPTIMENPWAALDYAKDVIEDRWPEAEPTIMRDPRAASVYKKHFFCYKG